MSSPEFRHWLGHLGEVLDIGTSKEELLDFVERATGERPVLAVENLIKLSQHGSKMNRNEHGNQ